MRDMVSPDFTAMDLRDGVAVVSLGPPAAPSLLFHLLCLCPCVKDSIRLDHGRVRR